MSMLKKQPLKSKPVCKVTFTLPESVKAESAYLVGDFNNWDEKATEMKKLKKNGQFTITLELDKEKEYQFRYLNITATTHRLERFASVRQVE